MYFATEPLDIPPIHSSDLQVYKYILGETELPKICAQDEIICLQKNTTPFNNHKRITVL